MKKKRSNKNFYYRNNRRNTPRKRNFDLGIGVYDDLGLDKHGKELSLIYENIGVNDVLTQNISKTEKILAQIEENKCYHLSILPLIEYGSEENIERLEKYLAKVVLKHPEYLYYLRPMEHNYGTFGAENAKFAAVSSKIAFTFYCLMWELDKESWIHPHKIIAQLKEYLLKIGKSEYDADIIIENCVEDD